jgi:transcriptional regulator with XRE-family HTH domain
LFNFAAKLKQQFNMNIRDNVKRCCDLRGITQKELAAKLGVTDISLNATLKEGRDPRVSTVKKIADALEVDIAELLSDRPQQTAEPEVVHVPYIRCPHCGKEIDVFVKSREEQQA